MDLKREMAYGWGPWTPETRAMCNCGHPRGDHLKHKQSCLHSTDEEVWVCDCSEFAAVS